MKHLIATLSIAMMFSWAAFAQDKKEKALTPQQQKMADCSAKAKGLKGDEFKKARSDCLKGGSPQATAKNTRSPQQQKMADCNASAKGLKSEEYKKKRDTCLKG